MMHLKSCKMNRLQFDFQLYSYFYNATNYIIETCVEYFVTGFLGCRAGKDTILLLVYVICVLNLNSIFLIISLRK